MSYNNPSIAFLLDYEIVFLHAAQRVDYGGLTRRQCTDVFSAPPPCLETENKCRRMLSQAYRTADKLGGAA